MYIQVPFLKYLFQRYSHLFLVLMFNDYFYDLPAVNEVKRSKK